MSHSDRIALYERLWAGPMFANWHWLQFNFRIGEEGWELPFAEKVLDALVRCDRAMPGFADEMLSRVETIGGRDRDADDYQSVLQWLAELVVVHHFVTWEWPGGASFDHEPTATPGGPCPEIAVHLGKQALGVEVKTPNLADLQTARTKNSTQLLSRLPKEGMEALGSSEKATLPRDNPLKGFLQDADRKFRDLKAADEQFYSLLVVVWDDFINEPLSALLSPSAGLLTENSFDRTASNERQTYPSVDAIVVLRHQHQLVAGMANRPPSEQRTDFLDYGALGSFPPNLLVRNPDGRALPPVMADALQAVEPGRHLGAEYVPSEVVLWIG